MNKDLKKEIGWILKEKYGGKMTARAKQDVKRLTKGEPVDYIIGFVDFLDCKIDLSLKPLIPRPETEFWAEKAITEIKSAGGGKIRCLDIFAGSGCIGVAVLKYIPAAKVDFAEKSEKFLKQIKINCEINKIGRKKFRVIRSDVFSNIRGRYDYIFANPPYVAERKKEKVQKSVLNWEPKSAVFGGPDGLKFIQKFLNAAPKRLKPGGKIFMEFSPEQKKKIAAILKAAGFARFEFHRDQYSRWRHLTAGKARKNITPQK